MPRVRGHYSPKLTRILRLRHSKKNHKYKGTKFRYSSSSSRMEIASKLMMNDIRPGSINMRFATWMITIFGYLEDKSIGES